MKKILWTLLLVALLAGCHRSHIYCPADEQVFLIEAGSIVTGGITTDTDGKRVDLETVTVPVNSVLLSEHFFLKLYREKATE